MDRPILDASIGSSASVPPTSESPVRTSRLNTVFVGSGADETVREDLCSPWNSRRQGPEVPVTADRRVSD